MNVFDRSVLFFTRQPRYQYVILFVIALAVFTVLHLDQTLADPDSFYHVKATQLLIEQGAVKQFPWLTATNLQSNFVDHHLLYHLVLVPFVALFPPLLGIKVATVLLASLVVVAACALMRSLAVKGSFWYALFLLSINIFVFRLGLAKAQQLVLILLFLFIYLLFTRRYLALAVVSALYVWLYAGWPLALVLAGLFVGLNQVFAKQHKAWLWFLSKRTSVLQQHFKLLLSVGIGLAAGIFFSPYFPGNIAFYVQQSFKIAVVNYQHVIGVGAEWYPYTLPDLVFQAIPFVGLVIVALVVFIASYQRQSLPSWYFLLLSFFFFALTLKSKRYAEYFVPLAVIFSGLSLSGYYEFAKDYFKKVPARWWQLLPLVVMVVLLPVFYFDLSEVRKLYGQGFAFDTFAEPSVWLAGHSDPGDIVFHSDWDEFPMLWFHNDVNYYIVGLDPTFMYEYDRDLYQRWLAIVSGTERERLHETIGGLFGARYVFVNFNQNEQFDRNLSQNFFFERVFENEEAHIYEVITP